MRKLNLNKCKTNKEVCELISKRVGEIKFEDLLKEVEKYFIFMEGATKAIYTGLYMNMNVFLSGKGGFGKTEIIKFILDFYKIPYHTVIGYKDMPVDALLGIPNMDKLLNESKYEINFKDSVFYKPGILIGEEFTDILPSTAAILKDILTEKGFRNKDGKVESLVASMIIAANKSSEEMVDDESKRALYNERFPIQFEVSWESYEASMYFEFLKLVFINEDKKLLYFMAKLFEYNFTKNIIISPRTAINITSTCLTKGIEYIDVFKIDTSYIDTIKREAERDFKKNSIITTIKDLSNEVKEIADSNISKEDLLSYYYFVVSKLDNLIVTSDNINNITDLSNALKDEIKILLKIVDKKESFKNITELLQNIKQ